MPGRYFPRSRLPMAKLGSVARHRGDAFRHENCDADATRQRAQALLASVYEPRLLIVQSLDSITVTAKSFQVPVVEPVSVNGTWEKVIPQSERSLISFDLPAMAQTDWIDMALETT